MKLQGTVQHYSWGGYEFIPSLLGIENNEHKPFAEYWLGAHSGAPSLVETHDGLQPLNELIKQQPAEYLGDAVIEKFGELPYLLKVLDVKDMLSIQVHPTKEEAQKGYDRENAEGISISATHRNYKDANHKPEMLIALSDFWLLHGFKPEAQLRHVISSVPEFASLKNVFESEGYRGLYELVMTMPQSEVDQMLLPLIKREICTCESKSEPAHWIAKLYDGKAPQSNIDRGVFSIYFFNLVQLKEGEGMFQAAGIPHAYLEGQNIELMANSDNVLRGGLTPKHIDVGELLKHTKFEGITPEILHGESEGHDKLFCLPVEDFSLCTIYLENGREYVNKSRSAEIFFVLSGQAHCGDVECKKGEAFIVLADEDYTIRAIEDAMMFKAFVPLDTNS